MNFDVSKEDAETIRAIVRRAETLAEKLGTTVDRMELTMDLTATHANGCPLKLAELLEADDGNFGHDVFGIRRYINREYGTPGSCFLPRCSV